MNKSKNLEYYFDSRIYSQEQIQENIEKIKNEHKNKKATVHIALNEFGMYIITFQFEDKNTLIRKILLWFRNIKQKRAYLLLEEKTTKNNKEEARTKSRLEKYYGNKYGQYESRGTYKPY